MARGNVKFEEYKNLTDEEKDYYIFRELREIKDGLGETARKTDLKILWLSFIIVLLLAVISIFTDITLPVSV